MPTTPTVYFHEDQHFRHSWLWALVALPIVVAMVSTAAAPRRDPAALIGAAFVCVGLALVFGFARLETEVRGDGVFVHFHGLWPTRRIPLTDIESYEARRYTLWDSGGWGVHFTMRGIAYNVSGNEAIIFQLKRGTGSRVLIGTQRPDEFAAAVRGAIAAR